MSATSVLEKTAELWMIHGVGLSTDRGSDYRMRPNPHEDLTFKTIGAAMRVQNRLGPGLKEAFYQRALSAELDASGLSSVDEQPIEIDIDGTYVGQLYIDHLVEDVVIVETKAVHHLMTNEEIAQVITYLCATGKPVGLLLNFGRERLEYKRIFPPRYLNLWKQRICRYVWMPPGLRSVNPSPPSVDSHRKDSST